MRILMVHNEYKQKGGEDTVFRSEIDLLKKHGHYVEEYVRSNKEIDEMDRFTSLLKSIYNTEIYKDLYERILKGGFDIVHFHNIHAVISPSGLVAAKKAGVKTVITIHNFRHSCLNATFFREGTVCESCLSKNFPLSGVIYKCYQGNLASSLGAASGHYFRRISKIIDRNVDRYITLSEIACQKLSESGVKRDKISIKPNFSYDYGAKKSIRSGYIYVGRISEEKGIIDLARNWKKGKIKERLIIIGEGESSKYLPDYEYIDYLGPKDHSEVIDYMRGSKALMFPSKWYEGMPMTIIEALSVGTPVLANKFGIAESMISDGYNGKLFEINNLSELKRSIENISNLTNQVMYSDNARKSYEENYSPEKNYIELIAIYGKALQQGKV